MPPRRVPGRASANLALAHSPQPDPRIDQRLHDPLDVPAEPVAIRTKTRSSDTLLLAYGADTDAQPGHEALTVIV